HRKAVSHAAFRLAVGHERGRDYHNAPGSTSYELRIKNSELVTGSTSPLLKRDLGCELYAARTTASQKRITDAYVTRCGERVWTKVVPERSRSRVGVWRSRIRDEARQNRTGKVRVIQ